MMAFAIRVDEPDSALKMLNLAINATELHGYKKLQAQARTIKGQILCKYATKLDLPLARAELQLARSIYTDITDTVAVASVYDNLCVLEQIAGKFDIAISYADSAIILLEAYSKREEEETRLGRFYNNKANIFLLTDRYNEAKKGYEQAIELSIAAGDTSVAYIAKENLLPILQFEGKFEEAIALYEELYEYYRSLNDKYSQVQLLNTKGAVYLRNGNYREAEQCYQTATKLAKQESYMMLYWDAELGLKEVALFKKKRQTRNTYFGVGTTLLMLFSLIFYQYYQSKKAEKLKKEKEEEIKSKITIIRSGYDIREEMFQKITTRLSSPLEQTKQILEILQKRFAQHPELHKNLLQIMGTLDHIHIAAREICFQLKPESVDWADRIKLSLQGLQVNKQIKTDFIFTDSDFEHTFSVEQGEKISLIASNLLKNMEYYSNVSFVRVAITRTNINQLKMIIHNNGTGLVPDNQNIFRLNNTRMHVEEMGGKMDMSSTPGSGSTIIVFIPIKSKM